MSKSHRLSAALSGAIGLALLAASVVQAESPGNVVEEVVVKGQLLREDASPYTADTLSEDQIRAASVQQSQEVLRRVAGLEIRNFGLGGVADSITLRGFGSGSHGGDLGFLIDGVPLNEAISHSDGYADLNVLIPLELGRVSVYKGPTSALYGNYNRAGTVFVQTRKGGDYRYVDSSGGSDSTFDVQGALGMETAAGPLNLAAQVYTTDGFRPQSEYRKGTISGRYAYALGERTELAFSGRAHQGDWNSGSYITADQFNNGDAYGVDPRVRTDGGDKDFYTARLDVLHELSPDLKLLGYAFGTQQDFTRYFTRPVNATTWLQREESYDRDVRGTGGSINGITSLAGRPVSYTAGVEALRESTGYDFADGLDNRRRVNPAIYDRTFVFTSTSAFFEGQWDLHPLLRPTLGLRYDRFDGECDSDGPETGADPCNRDMNTYDRTSPKFGVRSTVAANLDLRASWSSGFQLPNPRGLFSQGASDVDANVFEQIEVGAVWTPIEQLRIDLSAFQLDSRDEIRELPAGSGQFVNFGTTRREGVELSVAWTPAANWETTLAASQVETEVRRNPDATLIGRELAGIPESTLTLSVAYQPEFGFGGRVLLRDVGESQINPTNTLSYRGYTVLDAGATYRGVWGDSNYRAYLNLNNALDRKYASSSFIIGGAQLFAPAAPRQVVLGLQADF